MESSPIALDLFIEYQQQQAAFNDLFFRVVVDLCEEASVGLHEVDRGFGLLGPQ